MTYRQIKSFSLINDIEIDKLEKISNSIKDNGFIGCPILIVNDQLLTGSHRLAALRLLDESRMYIDDMQVAEDVTDLVNKAFKVFYEENEYYPDLDFSNIGWMFKGTWVEEYKNEIEE